MKKTAFLFLLLCPVFLAVNAQDQEIMESDIYVENNLADVNRNYETFSWMENPQQGDMQMQRSGQSEQMRSGDDFRTNEDLGSEGDFRTNEDDFRTEGETQMMDEQSDLERQGDEALTESEATMDRQKSEYDKKRKMHKSGEARMGKGMSGDFSIDQAIKYEMVSRGYEVDQQNPDVLIGYQVFSEDIELEGFNLDDDAMGAAATPGQGETVQAEKGSLLITFTDSESGTMIWKGLVTGAFSEAGNPQDDTRIIQAVSSVFDRFAIDEAATLGAGTR